mgnify:CR=1 FL=1
MKNPAKFRAYHKKKEKLYKVTVLTNEGCFLEGIEPEVDQQYGRFTVESSINGKFCNWSDIEYLQYRKKCIKAWINF